MAESHPEWLAWANIKLASVVTDITGVSARAMLQGLVDGQTDVTALAQLAKGRLRSKLAVGLWLRLIGARRRGREWRWLIGAQRHQIRA